MPDAPERISGFNTARGDSMTDRDLDRAIGNRVRKMRNFRGMTNAEAFSDLLAEHGLFIRATTLKLMEVGKKHISPERLEKIATALRCSADYLRTGDNPPSFGEYAKPGVKSQQGSADTRIRGTQAYTQAQHAALAMEKREDIVLVVGPDNRLYEAAGVDTSLCHGGDMVGDLPEAFTLDKMIAFRDAALASGEITPIQEVDSRLQERYSQRKAHIPRTPADKPLTLWQSFLAWLRG